ncbi:MAG: hypothetical protein GXY85_08785 [Candidatus Brocadiaceae bacterium]|nr:hypothetical protein [Candidatus Brocadiaceae bacterium]
MDRWLGVVLIVTSLTALGMATYCLIFMAPLERFRERVNALGGGLKGVESHFSGVAGELQGRVDELEERTSGEMIEAREAWKTAAEAQAAELRQARRNVEALRRDLQSLEEKLEAVAADARKGAQTAEALAKHVGEFRGDFSTLERELREAVRQLVADSLTTVESTVLAALEAVQEEILHDVAAPPGPSSPFSSHRKPTRPSASFDPDGRRENIITVEPLFSDMRQKEGRTGREEEPAPAPDTTEGGEEE